MRHNPALRALGFSADDRVVVVHADDVGMCGATVDAFFDLYDGGKVSAGSVMVPCPWFPEVAARCRGRTDLDVGVHLTLTSEWDGYRWGPISAPHPASGLLDGEGYLHRNQDRWNGIDTAAVRREQEAQVDRALAAGIDLTHVDCHMFATLSPALADDYVDLGLARGLPALVTRQPQWVAILTEPVIAGWEERGLPVFDHLREMPAGVGVGAGTGGGASGLDVTARLFEELPAGLTYLITHPARDTPELRAVASDWCQRVGDYTTFADDELAARITRAGVQMIGWRPLRELVRRGRVPA
ncbi:MAG: polysaccharide deacetylase family protein [Acidimicrobiia bacterium]|nr:polysaccharide deacetylase family protein [Acidimicrobiia bacterium]